MKKILLFSVILLCAKITAQQVTNTAFKNQMNTLFGPLDKTKVPTGVLLDYGMGFTNVTAFNGTLTDSTYTDMVTLRRIYNTLLSSRIRSNISTGFVTPAEFVNRWKNHRSVGVISIGGAYFKVNEFASNAITANRLTYSNNQFSDKYINSVWQDPYVERQIFAMAPTLKMYKGLSFQVKVPSNIFYSNYPGLVQSLQIDFGNGGGYVTVPFDQNVNVGYTTTGIKTWKYKLTLTNATVLYNHSKIKIVKALKTLPYGGSQNQLQMGQQAQPMAGPTPDPQAPDPTYIRHSVVSTKVHLGLVGVAHLTIDANGVLDKPLIVAEGFDLGAVQAPEIFTGLYDYSDFRNSLATAGNNLRNLIYEDTKQYDIIYVDWHNGTDYLQRNAYALEEVIKWVNSQKVGTAKNVILGQSMGGVIARYALADMESDGVNHDTRLFISHDAPQQGANVPVSFQYMFRNAANQFAEVGYTVLGNVVTLPILENNFNMGTLDLLDLPATKQLLANWANSYYVVSNSDHVAFFNELKGEGINPAANNGYPINCRNIAISNASECGDFQNFNPGDYLLGYAYEKGLSFWGDMLSLLYVPLGGTLAATFVDNNFYGVATLGGLPGNNKFIVGIEALSIPYGAGNWIYKAQVSYRKKVLYVVNQTVSIVDLTLLQPNGLLPMDTYAAGYYNASAISASVNLPGSIFVRDRFGFIPATSALDIGKRNVALGDIDYRAGYAGANPPVGSKASPFSNFTTDFDVVPNARNKTHISFTQVIGNWLANELNATTTTTSCAFVCNGEIGGPSILCGAQNYTAPAGVVTRTWQITSGGSLATLSNSTAAIITLTPTANASGLLVLSLTISDASGTDRCGSKTFTKEIWVGKPSFGTSETQPNQLVPAVQIDMIGNNGTPITAQGITSTVWEATTTSPSGCGEIDRHSTNLFLGYMSYSPPTSGCVTGYKITATNACGSTIFMDNAYGVPIDRTGRSGSGEDKMYRIAPNPTSSDLTISAINNLGERSGSAVSAILYDMYQQKRASVNSFDAETTISVRGLERGIYILKINTPDRVESHQVIVF